MNMVKKTITKINRVLDNDGVCSIVVMAILLAALMAYAVLSSVITCNIWDVMGVMKVNALDNAEGLAALAVTGVTMCTIAMTMIQLILLTAFSVTYIIESVKHRAASAKASMAMVIFSIVVIAVINISGGVAMLHIESVLAVGSNIVLTVLSFVAFCRLFKKTVGNVEE